MLVPFAAIFAALIFLGMAVFQALLAAGRPLGNYAWGGGHKMLPALLRWGSLVSALIFLLGIVVVGGRAGLIPWIQDTRLEQSGIWVLVVLFALSTLANLMSKSRQEKRLMAPIALLLALLCLIIAVGA